MNKSDKLLITGLSWIPVLVFLISYVVVLMFVGINLINDLKHISFERPGWIIVFTIILIVAPPCFSYLLKSFFYNSIHNIDHDGNGERFRDEALIILRSNIRTALIFSVITGFSAGAVILIIMKQHMYISSDDFTSGLIRIGVVLVFPFIGLLFSGVTDSISKYDS